MFLLARENNDGTKTFLSTHDVDQAMICGCVNQEKMSVYILSEKTCHCNNDHCKGVSSDSWMKHFMEQENLREYEMEETVTKLRKINATLDFYIDYSLNRWNSKVSLRLRGVNSSISKPKRKKIH